MVVPTAIVACSACALFGHRLSRASKLLREVLQLRKAILHRQDSFLVVDVDTGLERQGRQGRGENMESERDPL